VNNALGCALLGNVIELGRGYVWIMRVLIVLFCGIRPRHAPVSIGSLSLIFHCLFARNLCPAPSLWTEPVTRVIVPFIKPALYDDPLRRFLYLTTLLSHHVLQSTVFFTNPTALLAAAVVRSALRNDAGSRLHSPTFHVFNDYVAVTCFPVTPQSYNVASAAAHANIVLSVLAMLKSLRKLHFCARSILDIRRIRLLRNYRCRVRQDLDAVQLEACSWWL
jgi:hypothetical protein